MALRCEDVSKEYHGTTAVRPLNLDIAAGTVHALVGANGAGKSTLLGMMSGRTRPTSGRILVHGEPLLGGSPRDAHAAGIACVYQELSLVPSLSACANVFLGDELSARGMISESAMSKRYAELCAELNVDIPAAIPAGELSVATGQLVEIMRAVQRGSRVLLLDEPTAALSQRERDNLLNLIRRLREGGTTIVIVTHNLDEVLAVSDTVTVMRNAEIVQTAPAKSTSKAELVRLMIGGELPDLVEVDKMRPEGGILMEVRDCVVPGVVHGISLDVRQNEVVGIAGLVGAGRSTFLRAIAGAEPGATGTMLLEGGRGVPWPTSTRKAHRLGISFLPEDRKTEGLVLGMTITDNVTIPRLPRFSRFGLVNERRQRTATEGWMRAFRLNRTVGTYPVGQLSGGGQQKVAFARAMVVDPNVMIFDEPTRGVDVGAKAELLRAVRDFADGGKAALVTSSETEELLDICDRIVVISAGRLVRSFDVHQKKPTVRDVLDAAFGVTA